MKNLKDKIENYKIFIEKVSEYNLNNKTIRQIESFIHSEIKDFLTKMADEIEEIYESRSEANIEKQKNQQKLIVDLTKKIQNQSQTINKISDHNTELANMYAKIQVKAIEKGVYL